MLKSSTRKVYIVNNFKSDKIEQAIFILKSGCEISGQQNKDLALEAQKIINDYIFKIENEKKIIKKKKRHVNKDYLKALSAIFVLLLSLGALSYFLILGIVSLF